MEFILLGTLIGLIPAVIAREKGYSFFIWWFYGAALFIIALPYAILMKPDTQSLETRQIAEGMKKCPHCAELIKADANVCRYCGRDVATREHLVELPIDGAGPEEART
jgi:hypothetical protein